MPGHVIKSTGPDPDPSEWLFISREQKLLDAQKPFDAKKDCWVPDEQDFFAMGEIEGVKEDMVQVKVNGEVKEFPKDQVGQVNPPKFEKCEDMSNLTYLNDASVMYNLRVRYQAKLMYTYSGLFCIAVNPYKRYPIYTDRTCKLYMGRKKNEVPPHIFAVSDGAYMDMQAVGVDQSMLITGESGAGKTENTKKVISYFAYVGAGPKKAEEGEKKKKSLEDQIVSTNPVLEAFGNAKTTRNDNSSRFGKFIRIHFQANAKLSGADIENYLLEKARVISQASEERSYHIFYEIMTDYVDYLKEMCKLTDDIYDYTNVSQGKVTVASIDDKEDMEFAHIAFTTLNFDDDERDNIYKVTAITMHLGNMKFKNRGREDQAEPDGMETGQLIGELFRTNYDELYTNFCKPKIRVGAEMVTKGQSAEKAMENVGSLAKGLFDRQFKFLVKKCNATLETGLPRVHFVGVLDIAGFEIFKFNGFEQLCINFCNEKLQQFFNHHMFVLEQEEYKKEGIQWTFVDFGMDLQACIELFEKPMGVFAILEEESMFPKATDKTFSEKLNVNHLGKSGPFLKPKGDAHFGCGHYAGVVNYNITGWLDKNKDALNDTVIDQLKNCKNRLVVQLFADHPGQSGPQFEKGGGKKGKSGGFKTVSSGYRDQLANLMGTLNATNPHFIRCIVPNEKKAAGVVDTHLIMHQLTCNGVLEGIRICRKGFPNRMTYNEFKQRYKILGTQDFVELKNDQAAVTAIFGRVGLDEEKYRAGKTKVFFRAGVLAEIEDIREAKLAGMFGLLQGWVRGWKSRREFKKLQFQRVSLMTVQKAIRRYISLSVWPWYKLWTKIKPLMTQGPRIEDLLADEQKKNSQLEDQLKAESDRIKKLEQMVTKLKENENDLNALLDASKGNMADVQAREKKMQQQRSELEQALQEMQNRLEAEQDSKNSVMNQKKKADQEIYNLKRDLEDMEAGLQNQQKDKGTKDHQIRNLNDDLAQQEELINKLNKEKKHLQECNQKTAEDLQSVEDKCNHLNKVKGKLEQTLDELEDSLEREKKLRADGEKSKRKVEGDVKLAQEAIQDLERNKKEMESVISRKDNEINALGAKLEDEQALVLKANKQVKELSGRVDEVEEDLDAERQARAKAEKARAELAKELEELGERLDEAGGATSAQVELNKKREAELAKLRRDLEESNIQHDAALANLRKKHNDVVAEMSEQVDHLNKLKARADKDKEAMRREAEDARAQADALTRDKNAAEKMYKQMQQHWNETQLKLDEANRTLNDFDASKKKLSVENSDLLRQLEEAESQIGQLSKIKLSLANQLDDQRKLSDDESRERATLLGKFRNLEHDIDGLREQLDEETEGKANLLRQLAKATGDAQMYRAKYETEGIARAEELEGIRLKLTARLEEAEQQLENVTFKNLSLEKVKQRLCSEIETMHIEVERSTALAAAAEKKQKNFDKIIGEWKMKVDDLACELDASQKECRNYSTELFRVKACYDENIEHLDAIRRENKNLSDEIKDLMDQIGEGGRNMHEVQKSAKRLEIEKEELQAALEEAEAALEQEENKVLRAQLELSQVRQEIDRRVQEKEEEFDNTRKCHQRALESMQASLEAEAKGKAEALRMKKKLETDINELEIALDHSNKANSDLQKHIKKLGIELKDQQQRTEEEQRLSSEYRDQYGIAERRANALMGELEESRTLLEQSDRGRRQAEADLAESHEQNQNLANQNSSLVLAKRKLESEFQTLQADLEELLNEARNSEERAKKAMVDAARLADELRSEQEHAQNEEKARKAGEATIKDLQLRLEECETNILKTAKKAMAKLEVRIREVESQLDDETRRHSDSQKNLRKCERRIKELTFQSEEDKKNHEKMQDLVDKLQVKIKTYKRQIEEAEEIAALNLAKFRKAQQELETTEERLEVTMGTKR